MCHVHLFGGSDLFTPQETCPKMSAAVVLITAPKPGWLGLRKMGKSRCVHTTKRYVAVRKGPVTPAYDDMRRKTLDNTIVSIKSRSYSR